MAFIDKGMKRPQEFLDAQESEWHEYLKKERGFTQEKIDKMIAEDKRLEQERLERKRKSEERSEKIKATHALHDKLVKLGGEWIMKNTPLLGNWECSKCSIVTTEIVTFASETPDVLGFANDAKSVLLEAKISREDFKRDSKKSFRANPEEGMGDYRLYIAPKGLIKIEELPEKWGLIEVNEKDKCKIVKYAEKQPANKIREMYVLTSLIKRIGQNPPQGVSIRCYTHETKNNTSLIVTKEEKNEKEIT